LERLFQILGAVVREGRDPGTARLGQPGSLLDRVVRQLVDPEPKGFDFSYSAPRVGINDWGF